MLAPDEWQALLLSLRVAIWATVGALPLAIATALMLARGRFPGKLLLDALVHMPLVLPPVVTGFLLLIAFGGQGIAGRALARCCGLVFSFRWTGAALACAVMGFPLMVRAIRLSIEAIDMRLEAAAQSLGAPPAARFFSVTLPLALPGIITGSILCFAKALGEFGATITFVSSIPGETRTLSSAIYAYAQTPQGDAAAARLTVVSLIIAFAALAASEILQRRAGRRIAGLE